MEQNIVGQLTLFAGALHAKGSPSPESEAGWMIRVLDWQSNLLSFWRKFAPLGSSGKMSPEFSQAKADATLQAFWDASADGESTSLAEAGKIAELSKGFPTPTVSHGELLTLNTSEFRNDAAACLLSDILETGDHLLPYSLSAKACLGIIRRAAKRNKPILPELLAALRYQSTIKPLAIKAEAIPETVTDLETA
jgi:hypothetical protein